MAFKQVFVPLNHVLSLLDSEARRLMESGKHMILVQYTEKKDGILIAKYGRKGDSFDSSDMKYAVKMHYSPVINRWVLEKHGEPPFNVLGMQENVGKFMDDFENVLACYNVFYMFDENDKKALEQRVEGCKLSRGKY